MDLFGFIDQIDSFDVFEKYYPDLIAINSNGIVENKLDFSIREAEEMRVLTTATCIAKNVYVCTYLLPFPLSLTSCTDLIIDDF